MSVSMCIVGVHRSSPNSLWKDPIGNTVRPSWEVVEMPKQVHTYVRYTKKIICVHSSVRAKSTRAKSG